MFGAVCSAPSVTDTVSEEPSVQLSVATAWALLTISVSISDLLLLHASSVIVVLAGQTGASLSVTSTVAGQVVVLPTPSVNT